MIEFKRQCLLASDLDGTLLPNTNKRAPPGCLQRTRELLQAAKAAGCLVVYVSGRHLSLAHGGQSTFRLVEPDYWVCNVGTEIYLANGDLVTTWRDLLGPPLKRQEMLDSLCAIPWVSAQERAKQGPHKVSLYYSGRLECGLREHLLQRARMYRRDVRLIASVEEGSGRVLLDFIPEVAGKGPALHYLAKHCNMGLDQVFYAGDSGNDLDALASGVCGTLVGNAPNSVREELKALQATTAAAHLHLAHDCYGDGVMEGLEAHGFAVRTSN